MKIHIDIPPESPAVQRLISETKMYKDKYARSKRTLQIRSIHGIFANFMGFLYVVALFIWHSQLCWFSYTTSITILWVFLVSWTTRFFWGICATVALFMERRTLKTSAPKSEELKSLLEDNTDKQEQEKIQKYSIQLNDERDFYATFVHNTCIFETWSTLHLGYILCFYLSIRLYSRDIIPFWVVNVLEDVVESQDKAKIQKHSIVLADKREFYTRCVRRFCVMETLATFYLSGFLCLLVSMKLVCHGIIPLWIFYLIGYGLIWIGCLNGVVVVLFFGGIVFWEYWWKKRVASV